MKKRITIVVLTFFAFSLSLMAQDPQPVIKFENTTHNFGEFQEKDGAVTTKFWFQNKGNADLKIVSVRPSCGCTVSDWTRTAVKPGEKGYVSATYNPKNRPGQFRKGITVNTNDPTHKSVTLFISGKVLRAPKTKADMYPTAMGNLKFKSNHMAFMDTKKGEVKTDTMGIYNNSDQTMKISFDQLPSHLSVKAEPPTLQAGQEGLIIITYDSEKKNDWGLVFDRIQINTNDQLQPQKPFHVSARIVQDFSKLSPKDLEKAPVATFNTLKWNFGTAKSGDTLEHEFTLTNDGKHDLEILKVKSSCGCTVVQPSTKLLKKGKSTSIKATFNTQGRVGVQNKTITVITNDPKQPEVVLSITGTLEK